MSAINEYKEGDYVQHQGEPCKILQVETPRLILRKANGQVIEALIYPDDDGRRNMRAASSTRLH